MMLEMIKIVRVPGCYRMFMHGEVPKILDKPY